MADDEVIARCAQLCQSMAAELRQQRTTKNRERIDFAIRTTQRLWERINSLRSASAPDAVHDGDKLAKALAIAREMRPVISKAKQSAWKREMLVRLDELLS